MFLSVTRPFLLRLPDGDIHLKPGELIELQLTEVQVHDLFSDPRAKEHIRMLRIGSRLTWHSPLFGPCTGRVALLPEDDRVGVTDHSVTGDVTKIDLQWIRGVVPEPEHTGAITETVIDDTRMLSGT